MKKFFAVLSILTIATACNAEERIYEKDKDAFCPNVDFSKGLNSDFKCVDKNFEPINGIVKFKEHGDRNEVSMRLKNGKANGITKMYDTVWKATFEINFTNNDINNIKMFEDGKLKSEAFFIDGKEVSRKDYE